MELMTGKKPWRAKGKVQIELSSGAGPTDGHPIFLSSYHAEFSGIIAILQMIFKLCGFYQVN